MDQDLSKQLRDISFPYRDPQDLDLLMEQIGDSKIVLLGGASHGTHEYYSLRSQVSQRLIEEKGFNFISVEGDWPDWYRVNRYAKGYRAADKNAKEALLNFNHWPTWMWANWEMVEFVEWLRELNLNRSEYKKVGFYGLDVYSLWDSLNTTINYLQHVDPQAVKSAKKAYQCFEPLAQNVERFALTTALVPGFCERKIIEILLAHRSQAVLLKDATKEELLDIEQNAQLVVNAEKYYKTMLTGGIEAWNIREEHMVQTLERLLDSYEDLLEQRSKSDSFEVADMWPRKAKAIVWAHNTHLGDARSTDLKATKMVNLGQLVREKHGQNVVFSIGFGAFEGSVIAAEEWGEPFKRMIVPPAKTSSWENLFHQTGKTDQLFLWRKQALVKELLRYRDLRSIGVVYNPEHESGNFISTILPQAFDAFVYLEKTKVLSPLDVKGIQGKDFPETFPYAV